MIRKSNIALLDNDPREVIELAAGARKVPRATNPRLHALAAHQQARGWALHGDATRFQQQIEDAATLLHEHPADHDNAAYLPAPVQLGRAGGAVRRRLSGLRADSRGRPHP
ncbi:hypothetical protein [Actinoplanes aureus]|uniref:Uncharacterized protein n=1 Tax=Actinoplanes aureus TaxID=2792083 RepID=A0A931CMT2_9ACTN|nr:hypothetical protein [Actinoplanes aureus]MBG0569223.1 hypothetical protein [Actinoplanes aureus]